MCSRCADRGCAGCSSDRPANSVHRKLGTTRRRRRSDLEFHHGGNPPARSAQLYAIIARGIAAAGGVLPDENNKQSSRNTMKSTNSPSNAGRSLGLFLSLVLAGSATPVPALNTGSKSDFSMNRAPPLLQPLRQPRRSEIGLFEMPDPAGPAILVEQS